MIILTQGTGSGSLSHAFIQTIMPFGHLFTFDFHEGRCEAVRKEFEEHDLTEFVSVRCQDVCSQGFELHNEVDAVFLDLPLPWECIASSKEALRAGEVCFFTRFGNIVKAALR